eukprot:gene403-6418_t
MAPSQKPFKPNVRQLYESPTNGWKKRPRRITVPGWRVFA